MTKRIAQNQMRPGIAAGLAPLEDFHPDDHAAPKRLCSVALSKLSGLLGALTV